MKNRNQKAIEYDQKFESIPKDFIERLNWMYDKYNINESKAKNIITKRQEMINTTYYNEIQIVLYEEPEGSPRPRFRIVNRQNLGNEALSNSNFVHVYSITGAQDNMYMKRLITSKDFVEIEQLICTPSDVEYKCFFQTPKYFSVQDTFLSEIGLIRHLSKPDWDNAGKKYSDMMNRNIWLDDNFVVDGSVRKYYSILPRIEISLKYANQLGNKKQYDMVSNRVDFDQNTMNLKYFK